MPTDPETPRGTSAQVRTGRCTPNGFSLDLIAAEIAGGLAGGIETAVRWVAADVAGARRRGEAAGEPDEPVRPRLTSDRDSYFLFFRTTEQ